MRENRTWLLDLGNTRLKWIRADALAIALGSKHSEEKIAPPCDVPGDSISPARNPDLAHESGKGRLRHHAKASSQGSVHALAHAGSFDIDALSEALVEIQAGDLAWIASVASPATKKAVETALGRRGATVKQAATQADLAGVRIAYAEPARLGVDRFLALLGAHARAKGTWLIVSVGTALTIDLLDADGRHHGGLIAPSPTLMRASLAQRAPHLPADGGAVLDFATDTADALASGALLSARALITRSRHAAKQRLGVAPTLLFAGGGADALLEDWRIRFEHAPDLVLEGLSVYASAASDPSGG